MSLGNIYYNQTSLSVLLYIWPKIETLSVCACAFTFVAGSRRLEVEEDCSPLAMHLDLELFAPIPKDQQFKVSQCFECIFNIFLQERQLSAYFCGDNVGQQTNGLSACVSQWAEFQTSIASRLVSLCPIF